MNKQADTEGVLDLKIQELDLTRNLIKDFREVEAIVRTLKSLKVLRLK